MSASGTAAARPRHGVRPTKLVAATLTLLAVALGVLGCSAPTDRDVSTSAPAALARFYQQHLRWRPCQQSFQCARLRVPLDYTRPDRRTLSLAVVRAPATDPAHRIGSLVTNPGGPGESGVQDLEESYPSQPGQPSDFGPTVRADFDVVSFDPRGVGRSAPITCLDTHDLDRLNALDTAPTTPAQVDALQAGDQAFSRGCEQRSGELLSHVGTPDTARDMDVLRAALGEPTLYYLGYSYGTYLGAVYAGLFPTHLARAVLDGPLPPDLTTRQADLQQAAGFQTELNRFTADCVSRPDCPLGTDAATARTRLAGLLAGLRTNPLPTGSRRRLDYGLAETGLLNSLYNSPTSWPALRRSLAAALSGDGEQLLRSADDYNGRHGGGHYSNTNEANIAIDCLDHPDPVHSAADVQAALPAFVQAAPLTGASDAWAELQCAYWPVAAQGQPHPVHYAGGPPILVVGNTNDPATPYTGAQDMTRQLGNAVLLTYDYDGHTAYGRGSSCIDNAVDRYLTQAITPAPGTTCRPDPPNPSTPS